MISTPALYTDRSEVLELIDVGMMITNFSGHYSCVFFFVCCNQPTSGVKRRENLIMGENMNQNADPAAGQGTGEKIFTQDDVNRIVGERLAKEKAKNSGDADFARREQELVQRELHMTAKEMLSEKGLPVQLFNALNCTDKETMEKSISTIEMVFNQYKANATSNIQFKGFQPGVSVEPQNGGATTEDIEIRKAMGLRT